MELALNPAQQDAVTANENILCCACPGSGKTRVLVEKVKHVLKTMPSARIILTTFSRDAAREMSDRIQRALKKMNQEQLMGRLVVGTFHSLSMRQLKDAGLAKRILSQIEVDHVVHRAIEISRVDIPIDDAEAAIYACKADPDYAARHPGEAALAKAYQKELANRNACDFADLLLQANELMAKGQLKPIEATHVFADEFQDIDRVQFRWLGFHMAGNRISCAVGDDDQSIYGFRASLGYRGMMDFQANTGARIITLDTNYRSTARILESAARLISTNTDRVAKRLRAQRGDGQTPRVVQVAEPEHQAMDIITSLDAICHGNELPKTKHATPYRFGVRRGQAAVLARTNRLLDGLERIFNEYRVPYLRAGSSFWDESAAQVFLSLLQGLHSRDSTGIEVALRWAGVKDHNLRALGSACGGNLWNLLANGTRMPVNCGQEAADFVHFGHNWAQRLSGAHSDYAIGGVISGVHDWMKSVVTETCGVDELGSATARTGRKLRLRDLWILTAVKDALTDLKGPIPVRTTLARREGEQHIPRVILSTFHASKGLEFDHVFLIDVVTGVVPKLDEHATDADIEEERRAFYVAMTRARDSLTIYTGQEQKKVSEFLHDAELVTPAPLTMVA